MPTTRCDDDGERRSEKMKKQSIFRKWFSLMDCLYTNIVDANCLFCSIRVPRNATRVPIRTHALRLNVTFGISDAPKLRCSHARISFGLCPALHQCGYFVYYFIFIICTRNRRICVFGPSPVLTMDGSASCVLCFRIQ